MAQFNSTDLFGLNTEQLRILYSIEYILTQRDIISDQKNAINKEMWLRQWTSALTVAMGENPIAYPQRDGLIHAVQREARLSGNNTWIYLILLESSLFTPYLPLGESKDDDKRFAKLKFHDQSEYLKILMDDIGIVDSSYVDRFQKVYKKSIDRLSNKVQKIALGAASVVAVAGITAATAGALAGPIAVALFGSEFAGLSGAALTSACLAFAGGGAIAAGGAGVAGGVAAIVGGGALLGAAGGGVAVSATNLIVKNSPELVLTQAAKLEVVLKEVFLNAQQDIQSAQSIIEIYKQKILQIKQEADSLKLDKEQDRTMISNMKKSVDYLEKSYKEMVKFESAYELALSAE